jgi:hypothetical protein
LLFIEVFLFFSQSPESAIRAGAVDIVRRARN